MSLQDRSAAAPFPTVPEAQTLADSREVTLRPRPAGADSLPEIACRSCILPTFCQAEAADMLAMLG